MKKLCNCFTLLLALAATSAPAYDVAADFSITSNPNDTWSYGYAPSLGGGFNLFTVATNAFGGVAGWQQWSTTTNTFLGAYKNTSANTLTGDGSAIPPGAFVLHPGASSTLAVARWTAPSEGYWRVKGNFTGVHLTSTDVHIRSSTTALFDSTINGLGDTKTFDLTLNTSTFETLDFLVGDGGNGINRDATRLNVSIVNAAIMTIEKQGDTIVIRWPLEASFFQLEVTPTLAPTDWTLNQDVPAIEGSFWKVVHLIGPTNEFFRLRHYHPQES